MIALGLYFLIGILFGIITWVDMKKPPILCRALIVCTFFWVPIVLMIIAGKLFPSVRKALLEEFEGDE